MSRLRRRRGRWPTGTRVALMLAPALLVVGLFFGGGVIQALAQSFGYQPFLPGWSWNTDAYRDMFQDPAVHASWWLTLRVAVLSTPISTALGVAIALGVFRLPSGRRVAQGLLQANLAIPHLVGALCMLLLLGQTGVLSRLSHAVGLTASPADFPILTADRFGFGIIAEYVWKETPFIAVITLASLGRGIDELSGAARTLGASARQRLRHVVLPLITPPVASAATLVLAFSATAYEVPSLLGRSYPSTLSVLSYEKFTDADLETRPQAMAIALLLTVLTTVAAAIHLSVSSRSFGGSSR